MEIIEALVWLKPAEVDSPSSLKFVGWCPHLCVVRGHDDRNGQPLYMGVRLENVRGSETKQLEPGQSSEVTFQLIYFDAEKPEYVELYRPLKAGREFEIREGGTIVGTGCVQNRCDSSSA